MFKIEIIEAKIFLLLCYSVFKKLKNKHFRKIPSQKFVYKQFNAYLCLVNSKFTQKRTTNCFLTY